MLIEVPSAAVTEPPGGQIELLSTGDPAIRLSLFPDVERGLASPHGPLDRREAGLFAEYAVGLPARHIPLEITPGAGTTTSVRLPHDAFQGVADILLQIRYQGDVGYASIDGKLISDNFANGAPWEIGLRRFEALVRDQAIDLYITPLRAGQVVASDSAMAVSQTFVGQETATIELIEAVPQYQVRISPVRE
jgi:hypothetical protein